MEEDNFWHRFEITLTRDGDHLDLSDPVSFLKWVEAPIEPESSSRIVTFSHYVASSKEFKRFLIADPLQKLHLCHDNVFAMVRVFRISEPITIDKKPLTN